MSNSLQPHRLQPTRLLCPWDFPGIRTGVDCYFLPQGIFPTQGSNPGLSHCRQTLYCLSHIYIYIRGVYPVRFRLETVCDGGELIPTGLYLDHPLICSESLPVVHMGESQDSSVQAHRPSALLALTASSRTNPWPKAKETSSAHGRVS